MIRLPPLTEPVKQTFAMSGFWMSAPMFSSLPVTTFSTPAGSFSATRCTSRVVASGAEGGGFTITVLPASRAWGRAAARIAIGQLKGTMIVTTPERLVRHLGGDRDAGHHGKCLARVDLVGDHQREVPADLEDQGVDPGLDADLAVLLRQDRRIRVPVVRDAGDRLGHLTRPLGVDRADQAG